MVSEEPVYVWRYVLRSKAALNAKAVRREFEGALLRVGAGFGCLHPWPELGDPGLDDLLRMLSYGDCSAPLVKRAVFTARSDGKARAAQRSLFAGIEVPVSHATLPSPDLEGVERAVAAGFTEAKLKGGKDYAALAELCDEGARQWPALRWRIDFNGVLDLAEAMHFGECLTDRARERIDFLEDPCPYHDSDWRELKRVSGLALANDWGADPRHEFADVFVVKPAREYAGRFRAAGRMVVLTSNMDHPVGQCFAAVEAGFLNVDRMSRVLSCGLQTHELFEPDEFSERLGPAGPVFRSPGGTGLGFDDLLEKLPWKRLR